MAFSADRFFCWFLPCLHELLPFQIFQRLSEEAGSGLEETQDRCIAFLMSFRKQLRRISRASASETEKVRLLEFCQVHGGNMGKGTVHFTKSQGRY